MKFEIGGRLRRTYGWLRAMLNTRRQADPEPAHPEAEPADLFQVFENAEPVPAEAPQFIENFNYWTLRDTPSQVYV